MNNLEYFKLLPEIMSYEDINEEFLRFIENFSAHDKKTKKSVKAMA